MYKNVDYSLNKDITACTMMVLDIPVLVMHIILLSPLSLFFSLNRRQHSGGH